ncbi:MAG: NEL-type E3 ubiquitin ligase domain-containing protein [Candidatus Endonucleobacter bathymodioli]|uniref:NEL-type E3 ubiquitin ligase domain-containing protein n=1 Tax=Candidatus Endonucleibacter bathymodioli TaxID=539814 RepID=A0AA90SCA1_9GAMM|nr:NEL-type E3 ubiquitin ligase domain-containing protein [Candidatus Endonucleobacter bathymodioli]
MNIRPNKPGSVNSSVETDSKGSSEQSIGQVTGSNGQAIIKEASTASVDNHSVTNPNTNDETPCSIQPTRNIIRKDLKEKTSTVSDSTTKTDAHPNQAVTPGVISNCDKKILLPIKEIEANVLKKLIIDGEFCDNTHYNVKGDLEFVNEPCLTKLPSHLTVTEGLTISRCANLETLSSNLNARSISIDSCHKLTTLSENLHTTYLSLSDCNGLIQLPETLKVDEDATISECPNLKYLPPNFVKHNLEVTRCGSLTTFGDDLTLTGQLKVSHCNNLTNIVTKDLTVESLFIDENEILQTVAKNICAQKNSPRGRSDCTVKACPNLITLAETIIVAGIFAIRECSKLMHLPTKLEVGGMFMLSYCDKITTLGDGHHFTGVVSLKNLKHLESVGNNIIIGGRLTLMENPNLKTIGNDITAHDIVCIECLGLEDVGDRIAVKNNFGLVGCTKLVTINDTLKVEGDFFLDYCVSLAHLPDEKFELGGDLSLVGCDDLTNIPDWIKTLGAKKSGDTRCVYLPYNNTRISTVTEELLRNEVPGMKFIRHQPTTGEEALYPISSYTFGTFAEAFTFWKNLASPSQASVTNIPIPDLQPNESADLIKFLELLTTTEDYKDKTSRKFLAERVVNILPLIIKKSEYQEHFLNILFSYLNSCIDGINFSLNELETALLIKDAEAQAIKSNNPSALKEVGMKIMILAKIKKISEEYITQKLSGNDPVAVRLGFQIGLQEKFNLPGLAKSMHFVTFSGVKQEDIDKAIVRINDSCTDAELDVFLTTWEPWGKYQRSCDIPKFDILSSVPVANINECAILHDTCNEMVLLNGVHVSYEALCKFFVESGNNPFTNKVLNWSEVHKLILSDKG